MSQERRRGLLAAATLIGPLLAGIAIIAVGHFAGSPAGAPGRHRADAEPVRRQAGAPATAGEAAPPVRLEDAGTASRFESASLAGRPYAVVFASTRCTGLGKELRQVLDALGNRPAGPLLLAISSEPGVDSAPRVRRWLSRFGLGGRLPYLIGDEDQLRPYWTAWGATRGSGCETPLFHLVNSAGRNAGVVALAPRAPVAGLVDDLAALTP